MTTQVNKSEFQAYLQTEKKLYDFNEKAIAHAYIDDELFNKYSDASEAMLKQLDAQVEAACSIYGINRNEFINQLNQYSENN